MKTLAQGLIFSALILSLPAAASAGLLDQIKQAAQNAAQNSGPQPASNAPQAGTFGGGFLPAAHNATTVNDDMPRCMAQTYGIHENLTAQVLQRKLPSLSAGDQKTAQEDIAWLNATAGGQRVPAPDPRNPQRYMLLLTDAEQQEINGATNQFVGEVHDKCEYQFGGMSQFGDPSGRPAHAPIDTHVALPDLLHGTPLPAAPTPVESYKNCAASNAGLRWKLMADKLQQKMDAAGLPDAERKEWQEDIAVLRAAQNGDGRAMPVSADPRNPMRYMMRFTPQEQVAVNQEAMAAGSQARADCMNSATGGQMAPVSQSRSQELADMHARRAAERAHPQAVDSAAVDAEVQAWLAARPFTPKAYAPGSATQADYLQKSGTLECFDRQKGFRAHEIARKLMSKRMTAAPQDHQELEAWISAYVAAGEQGRDEAAPAASADPQGWMRFLSSGDQQEINAAASSLHNKIMTECESLDFMENGAKNSQVKYGQ
jgi:hypothetical protein